MDTELDSQLRQVADAALGRLSLPELGPRLLEPVLTATGAPAGSLLVCREGPAPLGRVAGTLEAEELAVEALESGAERCSEDLLAVPLHVGASPAGVCVLAGASRPEALRPALPRLAWALDRARRWDHQLLRSRRLAALQSLTGRLSAATQVEEVAELVVEVARAQPGCVAAAIWHRDERAQLLRTAGTCPPGGAEAAGEAFRSGHVTATRGGEVPGAAGPGGQAHTLLAAPVAWQGEAFGALTLVHDGSAGDDADPAFVAAMAEQAAAALVRVRLRAAEQASLARLQLLVEASAALGTTLDVTQLVDRLLTLLVDRLTDSAVLRLVDGAGRWSVAGVRHADPSLQNTLSDLLHRRSPGTPVAALVGQLAQAGELYVTSFADAQASAEHEADARDADLVRRLDVCCTAVLPLLSPSGLVGALTLAHRRGSGHQHLTGDDETMLRELGLKAGAALRNATVHGEAREVAVTLQRSLLPQRVPELPGLAFAWRYLPGAAGVHIGGDWYDAIALEHGCVGVLIGDVMGRGVQAAAIMGQLRATARAYASALRPPSEVLSQLDVAVGRLEQGYITTALFAVLDPATGACTVASAGHLPPLLVDPAGTASFVELEPGPPLGAGLADYPERTIVLEQGSTLLLYTDGLVENRLLSVDAGMAALRESVDGLVGTDPETACERALLALGRDREYADDTAILAVSLTGLSRGLAGDRWSWRLPDRPEAVGEARRELRRALESWAVPPDFAQDILVVATELSSNAQLHVGGEVVVSARHRPGEVRVEVRDTAPARKPLASLTSLSQATGRHGDPELDELVRRLESVTTTGRGMAIVDALSQAWGTATDGAGKTVWATFRLPGDALHGPARVTTTDVTVDLRDVPVRLILASAANLDELVREFVTADEDWAMQKLGADGMEMLRRTGRTREPFRVAAREAYSRAQRLVDVRATASPATVATLRRFWPLVDEMVAQCRRGQLLALTPTEEIVEFRRWYADEVARQVDGGGPATCPFPALPAS